jgi:hypothetical protein
LIVGRHYGGQQNKTPKTEMSAYDDAGITQTVDFAYGDIDPEVNDQLDIDAVLEMHRRVWQWVYQPPCKDLDGFFCRSIIACWLFVPLLRDCSQTEIAGRFGKKKQSLNRWLCEFKVEFPELADHIQHTKHTK